MKPYRLVLLGMLLGPRLVAQGVAHSVSGVVFDSIARVPLAGAVVQVALVDGMAPAAPGAEPVPRIFTATADAGGRYRIPGLPSGRFAIGFQHEALSALGLESPLRAFRLGDDTSVTVDLAIPTGAAVREQLCGAPARPGEGGLVTGYVSDARRQGALPGAVVRARWVELALQKGNYRVAGRTVTAPVGADGHFLACGLTTEESVILDVTMPGYQGITQSFALPAGGVVRQDFRLADSGVVRGSAGIAGRVVLPDGRAIGAGRVRIDALGLEVPVADGAFALSGLPAGTWVVEAKAIGHEPQSVLVDAREGGVAGTTIALAPQAQLLDAITVYGTRGSESRIRRAIASRRTTSVGSVFLPGDPYLESSYDPADVLRRAPGFRYVSAEVLLASGCGFRYPPPDEPITTTGPRGRTKRLVVYLDGARVHGGLPELRTAVTMRDVFAIEAYQDIANAPLEWRTYDACAVMAIWTKR